MSTDAAEDFDFSRFCNRVAHCPICSEPNGCRLETGEPYKGPCWCERVTLPAAAASRLRSELPEQRCLCRTCLEGLAANPEIRWDELAARRPRPAASPPLLEAGDFYLEGMTIVFTEQYHLRRGTCCNSDCRHCPFKTREHAQT